jgi:ribosome-binding protein aMBF1 (putative translation factor)
MPMTRSYKDIMADRAARSGPESAAYREVFERAYDLALQVIELRERHGLTQKQLAERCGIDQADISRIERGSTNPTARTLQRIAEALDAELRLVARRVRAKPPGVRSPRQTTQS